MLKFENHCCNCSVPGYPCVGSSCKYVNVPVYYCDMCNYDTYADYEIDGEHYCVDCATKYVESCFDDLSLSEQADILGISLKGLGD